MSKLTYVVYIEREDETGFIYSNLRFESQKKKGFTELEAHWFSDHFSAVRFMIKNRKICAKHNIALDPNYLPPSKRTKVLKRRKRTP